MRDSSSQSSTDSQYEEVSNRPTRSLSSNASFDEDDLADGLYSCVGAPSGAKSPAQPAQGPGEMYSLVGAPGVGASTLPRTTKDGSDAPMYELVGSRPPSKSAPPTYEMAQSAKKSSPSKTIQENAQEPAESADLYVNSPQAEEDTRDIYSLVQEPVANPQTSPQTSPQIRTGEDEKKKPADVYSLPNINRKQKQSARGLSIISESAESGDELSPVPDPEESAPPLPPKINEESFAIEEIKRFLEETKLEEEENEQTNGKDLEEEAFPDQTVSAIQQLKEFLHRLDSTEEE